MWDQESRALLATHAPLALIALDAEATVTRAEGALLDVVEPYPGFLAGRPLTDAFDEPSVDEAVAAALAGLGGAASVTRADRALELLARPAPDGALVLLTLTDLADLRAALVDREAELERFRALVELSKDFIAMADFDGTVTFLNRAGRELVGLPADDDALVLRRPTNDFFTDAGRARSHEIEDAVRTRGYWEGESELHHFGGEGSIPVSANSFLVTRGSDGTPLALATVQRDLRHRVEVEHRLSRAEEEQRHLAALGRQALTQPLEALAEEVVRRLDDRYPGLSTAVNRTVAHDVLTVVDGELDCPVPGVDGAWGTVSVHGPADHVWSDTDVAFVESLAAVLGAAVRRAALEDRLEHQALHDVLTGLPNRPLVQDRMDSAVGRAERHGTLVAVLLLDLDDFKGVNDSQGHAAGDVLLNEVSRRFESALPPGDTLARLGGDEFVVVAEDLTSVDEAVAVAERLLAACTEPFDVAGVRRSLTTSIGIAVADGSGDPATLLTEADIAMYAAKRARPGSHRFFDESMRTEVLGRVSLSAELRAAIDDRVVEVWYQPIVDVVSARVVALEALARWRRPDGSFVPPHTFVPLAEEIGVVGELGTLVLEQAVAAAVRWREEWPDVALRVNASAEELRDPGFAARVDAVRAAAGLPSGHLGIEITESVLVDEGKHTQANLHRLKDAGISLLLDDFGTGYSSLSYLQRFPQIDVLKIDRSFLHDPTRGAAIVRALIELGGAFGFTVCAEGVETAPQFTMLQELGCELAQGYLFAQPVPAGEVAELLERLD
ncbi:putative bifunctional diguanylate cyclase/phosphodiesterase [Nocardioides iriomotensis]|nr:EAL domain-containing protein [Nocardioides iriomotensis]